VGYTAFVTLPADGVDAPGRDGSVAAIHPDRVIAGRYPDRGLVLAGVVTSCRPAGALWEIAFKVGGALVTGRLAEAVPVGQSLAVTALDPPLFAPGPDGANGTGLSEAQRNGRTGVSK